MKVGDAEGVCVRGGKICTSCTPCWNRRCDWNFSTSETDTARSTTELELSTRPTPQFKLHAINEMGRANTEKRLPPSNGIYGTRNPVYLTNPNLSLNPKSKPTSSPILFPSCYFIFRSADCVSRVSQDLLYVCVSSWGFWGFLRFSGLYPVFLPFLAMKQPFKHVWVSMYVLAVPIVSSW